jgi:hypothetical protein
VQTISATLLLQSTNLFARAVLKKREVSWQVAFFHKHQNPPSLRAVADGAAIQSFFCHIKTSLFSLDCFPLRFACGRNDADGLKV